MQTKRKKEVLIIVDIMALQDSSCALASLAVCATETSGSVNVLHPLEWGTYKEGI